MHADTLKNAAQAVAITPANASDIDVRVDRAANGDEAIRLWAKGHFDEQQFLIACERALLHFDGRRTSLGGYEVLKLHWRTRKAKQAILDAGLCTAVRAPTRPGFGAYPVTTLAEWLPLNPELHQINMTTNQALTSTSSNGIAFICEQIPRINFVRKAAPSQTAPSMSAEQARDLLCLFGGTPRDHKDVKLGASH